MAKGRKVYVEGRLTTRTWTGQDGAQKSTTEVIISDMILLDSSGRGVAAGAKSSEPEDEVQVSPEDSGPKPKPKEKKGEKKAQEESPVKEVNNEEVAPDDIPF